MPSKCRSRIAWLRVNNRLASADFASGVLVERLLLAAVFAVRCYVQRHGFAHEVFSLLFAACHSSKSSVSILAWISVSSHAVSCLPVHSGGFLQASATHWLSLAIRSGPVIGQSPQSVRK